MKWKGAIKDTFLQLPEDFHAEMRAAGLRLGLKAGEAYTEAGTQWLEGPRPILPAGKNAALAEALATIERIWGDRDARDAVIGLCRVLAKKNRVAK